MEIQEKIKGDIGIGNTFRDLKDSQGYGSGKAWDSMDNIDGSPTDPRHFDPASQKILQEDPEYTSLEQEAREGVTDPALSEFYNKIALNKDEVNQRLEQLWLRSTSPTSVNYDRKHEGVFYRLVRKDIVDDYFVRRDEIMKGIKDRFPDQEIETPFEKAEDQYNRLLFADDEELVKQLLGSYVPIEDKVTGDINWDERDRREKYLVDQYSQKYVDDMRELSFAKGDWPEGEIKYRKDMDYIRESGYWDIEKDILEKYPSSTVEKFKKYKLSSVTTASELRRENSIIGVIEDDIEKRQKHERRADDDLDSRIRYWFRRASVW